MLFGYVVGYLVKTKIGALASGTLAQISKEIVRDRWRQHRGNLQDSSNVRDVTPSTSVGLLYQSTRCHI